MSDRALNPPVRSEVVDISSTDHTFAITNITAIYNNSGTTGTVVAKLVGDSASRPWKVVAGQYLIGRYTVVERSGTTLTATNDLIGVTGLPSNTTS
jgi:hypothetical protein